MENYLIHSGIDRIPSIDFAHHSLLLARGVELYDTRVTIKSLQALPNRSYVMTVKMTPNAAAVVTNWQVAIITKLEDGAIVRLHVENE